MNATAKRFVKSARIGKSELLTTTAAPKDQHDDSCSTGESNDQRERRSSTPEPKPAPTAAAMPSAPPHRRQGDRGSSDAAAPPLPTYVRYHDLRAAGIVSNWPQLYNLVDDYGFPEGVMLSPNTRAWRVEDIEHWLASRPVERKKVATPFRKQQEKEVA
jgi:hypothetical protein